MTMGIKEVMQGRSKVITGHGLLKRILGMVQVLGVLGGLEYYKDKLQVNVHKLRSGLLILVEKCFNTSKLLTHRSASLILISLFKEDCLITISQISK